MTNITTLLSRFKLLFTLIGLLTITIIFGNLVPIAVKSFFYAISLSIKNILVFLLPFIIFIFLCSSLIALQHQAGKFVVLLLILVTISNFIGIIAGYEVGVNILPLMEFKMTASNNNLQLFPTWNLALPQIVATKFVLPASTILGLFFAFKPNNHVSHIAQKLDRAIIHFFKIYFTPILPLFILGFLLKLEHEKILSGLVTSYGPILLLIVSTQLLYIIIMYLIAAKFKLSKSWEQIKNMIPATITAFSTISSAATLPVTIMCTEKNLKDKNFAKIIVPATCNAHSLGSAIGLTIVALAALQAFHAGLPDFKNFIDFAIYFTLAKYAIAGVPGGAVVVAAPLLESYLGLTPEMIGIVTAVYLLFDTFGTATNVTGNGAFAIIFSKVYDSRIIKKIFGY
jgi:Na+/H+-dicarboxylate symporter